MASTWRHIIFKATGEGAGQAAYKETAREVGEVLAEGRFRNQMRRVFQEEWNGQQYGPGM